MLEETLKEIKESFKERVGDPIIRYYWTFFFLRNWKPVIIIFLGQEPIEKRLQYAYATYSFPYNFESCQNIFVSILNIGLPALFAILMFAYYPGIKQWIVKSWETRQVEIENEKLRVIKKRLIDQEQVDGLYAKISSLETEIDALRSSSWNLAGLEEYVITGAKEKFGGEKSDYRFARIDNSDLANLSSSGMWVFYDEKTRQARLLKKGRDRNILPTESPALLLHILESQYILIKVRGRFNFGEFPDLRLTEYRENKVYFLTIEKVGIPVASENPSLDNRRTEVCFCYENDSVEIASDKAQKNGVHILKAPIEDINSFQ